MHKPVLAGLLLFGVLLSGCADSGGDDLGATGAGFSSSASLTTTGPPPKPVVYGDTLHLLAAPDMAMALPASGPTIETGTAGDFGPGGGGRDDGPPSNWAFNVTGNSSITGAQVHVWIDVKEQLLQGPGFPPTEQPCTWYVRLALGADGEPEVACQSEPVGPIAAGIQELTFEFPSLDVQLERNETITFLFGRSVFSTSQSDAVAVLSGTTEYDSRIVLTGLKEAIPETPTA